MNKNYRNIKKELDDYANSGIRKSSKHIVHMNVNDDSNFLSVFSASKSPVISQEVADFIEASTHAAKPTTQLTLKIQSSCIDDAEKTLYRQAIKEYYTEKYIAAKQELKKNYRIAYILGTLGVLVLALAVFLEYRHESVIWAEVIDIVAWVFLWEAVDVFCLETRKLKANSQRYISYVAMEVEFEDN